MILLASLLTVAPLAHAEPWMPPVVALRASVGVTSGLGATASLLLPHFQAEVGAGWYLIMTSFWGRLGPTFVLRPGDEGRTRVLLSPMLGYVGLTHAHEPDFLMHGVSATGSFDFLFPAPGRWRPSIQLTGGLDLFVERELPLPELRAAFGAAW